MKQLSANQIYNLSKEKISFAEWIDREKKEYISKVENRKITTNLPFLTWLNRKWYMKLNASKSADGTTIAENIAGSISDVITKTKEKITGSSATTDTSQNQTKPETILGLKKGTFYIVTGLTILTIAYITYRIIKNKNK